MPGVDFKPPNAFRNAKKGILHGPFLLYINRFAAYFWLLRAHPLERYAKNWGGVTYLGRPYTMGTLLGYTCVTDEIREIGFGARQA